VSDGYSFSFADARARSYCYASGGRALVPGVAGAVDVEITGDGPFEVHGVEVGAMDLEPLGDAVMLGSDQRREWVCRARGKAPGGAMIDGYGTVALGPTGLGGTALRRDLWVCVDEDLAFLASAERRHARDGHGDEKLAVIVARGSPLEPSAIADPRLSTSYGADGQVLRAGLELWEGEDAGERERSRALRLAGEAVASGELERTSVAFMVWRHAGREGIGCYAIERAG